MKEYFIDVLRYHYFDFKGRATRKQYWLFTLWFFIIFVAIFFGYSVDFVNGLLFSLLSWAIFIPQLAIFVRRLRDGGHSTYWGLLMVPWFISVSVHTDSYENAIGIFLIACLCSIPVLILSLLPSKKFE